MKNILTVMAGVFFALDAFGQALFRPNSSGVVYKSTFNQAPYWERSSQGTGMVLDYGITSFALSIAHHPDTAKVSRDRGLLESFGRNVRSSVKLVRFSRDLRTLWLNVNLANDMFRLSSGLNNFNVLVKAQISACNGEPLPDLIKPSNDLRSTIESFYAFDISKILYCDLKIERVTSNVQHRTMYSTHNNYGFSDHFVMNKDAKILIHGDRNSVTVSHRTQNPQPQVHEGTKTGPNSIIVEYFMDDEQRNEEQAALTLASAEALTDKLLDYSDLILAVYDKDESHKTAARQAFFNAANVKEFRQLIAQVTSGLDHLNIREAITINVSVNQAYAYVRYFEKEAFDRFELDYQIDSFEE